jgi:hypothetical protein
MAKAAQLVAGEMAFVIDSPGSIAFSSEVDRFA